jgi:hypothetical protein
MSTLGRGCARRPKARRRRTMPIASPGAPGRSDPGPIAVAHGNLGARGPCPRAGTGGTSLGTRPLGPDARLPFGFGRRWQRGDASPEAIGPQWLRHVAPPSRGSSARGLVRPPILARQPCYSIYASWLFSVNYSPMRRCPGISADRHIASRQCDGARRPTGTLRDHPRSSRWRATMGTRPEAFVYGHLQTSH